MKVGDLVKHKLNKGAWFGIITKHRVIGWGHSDNYYVVWQVAGRGWFYTGDLEVICK